MSIPVQVICSNPVDLSLSGAQNIWTTRVSPTTNVVITGAIFRDTTGAAVAQTVALQINIQGNNFPLVFVVDPALSGPRFLNASVTSDNVGTNLVLNPTVTATVLSGGSATSQIVQVDLVGYFI